MPTVSDSEPVAHRNGPNFPLEIKDMIIDELANRANPSADDDLRAMMSVWPESLRTIRKHRFACIRLIFMRPEDLKINIKRVARLFTLLQTSSGIKDYVTELILRDDDDRGIFPLSSISYLPGMLVNMNNIRRLDLTQLSFLPKVMPNFPTFVSALSGCKQIQSLMLYQCAFDFLDLVALLNAVPSLKDLTVGRLQIRTCGVGVVLTADVARHILRFAPGPGTRSMSRLMTTTLHLNKVALSVYDTGDFIFWDFLWSSVYSCGTIVAQRMHNMIDCTRSSLQSLHLGGMGVARRQGRPVDLAHLRKLRFELAVSEWRLTAAGDPAILDWYIRTFQNLPSRTLIEELIVDLWTEDRNYSEPSEPRGPDVGLWRDLDEAFVGPQLGLQKLTFIVRTLIVGWDVPWEGIRQNTERWLLEVCLPRTREHFFADNRNDGRMGIITFKFPKAMGEGEAFAGTMSLGNEGGLGY
ncbi:hypothetical protein BDZ89DRAFT_1062924 [Hymenopellis radicata]|nr:hypothetical protein BDZ89DRAFT_1062924 [Hymenopellis radicata]